MSSEVWIHSFFSEICIELLPYAWLQTQFRGCSGQQNGHRQCPMELTVLHRIHHLALKGQGASVWGFASHRPPVMTTQFCHCHEKAAIDEWAQLCYSKTLLTKRGSQPDSTADCSLLSSGLMVTIHMNASQYFAYCFNSYCVGHTWHKNPTQTEKSQDMTRCRCSLIKGLVSFSLWFSILLPWIGPILSPVLTPW